MRTLNPESAHSQYHDCALTAPRLRTHASAFSIPPPVFPPLRSVFPVPLVLLPFRCVCARRFSRRGPAPFRTFSCLLSRARNNKMVSCLDSCHLNVRNCIFLQKSSENILPVRKKSVPLHSLSGKNPGCTQKNEFFERLRTSKQGSNAASVSVSGDESCGS